MPAPRCFPGIPATVLFCQLVKRLRSLLSVDAERTLLFMDLVEVLVTNDER